MSVHDFFDQQLKNDHSVSLLAFQSSHLPTSSCSSSPSLRVRVWVCKLGSCTQPQEQGFHGTAVDDAEAVTVAADGDDDCDVDDRMRVVDLVDYSEQDAHTYRVRERD